MIYKGKLVVMREFPIETEGNCEKTAWAVWDGPFSTKESAREKAEERARLEPGVGYAVATIWSGLRQLGKQELF